MEEEGFFSYLYEAERFVCCGCREEALRDDIKEKIAENTFNKERYY